MTRIELLLLGYLFPGVGKTTRLTTRYSKVSRSIVRAQGTILYIGTGSTRYDNLTLGWMMVLFCKAMLAMGGLLVE